MKKAILAFAANTVFANIVLILIFLGGWLAVKGMIKETYPEFSLDMITISVAYPGADPLEVEEAVNSKIENALEGLEGIRQYTTTSSENLGKTLVEVKEGYPVRAVLDRVRTKIEAISAFPAGAERPVITEFVYKEPVITLYVSGPVSERRLKQWAEGLKEELTGLAPVSQVDLYGHKDPEISIELSEERLKQYNLSFNQVAEALRKNSLNLAGGTIRTRQEDIRIRTLGRKYTGRELGAIVVLARPDGSRVTLDRIADIRDGFAETPMEARVNGEPALMIQISKTREEDSMAISEAVRDFVETRQAILPEGAHLSILYDNTDILRSRIDLLVKNGIQGILIVFLLLWAFLNVRLAFWVGMGIPVAVAGGLVVLWFMGATVNMISLFGMIIVLGILVDDAIVVGEAIAVQLRNGSPPLKAAADGLAEVGFPVLAACATSVVAFVPMLFVQGIIGKFIAILPVVVIACLTVSLVECFFLLPAHLSHQKDSHGKRGLFGFFDRMNQAANAVMERFAANVYLPLLDKILQYRYIALCTAISVLLLTVGVLRGGLVKFSVFPEIDGFVITSTVKFPDGTPAAITRKAVRQIEDALLRLSGRTATHSKDPLIVDRLSMVGRTLAEFPEYGAHMGAVQAVLLKSEKRGIHTKDLMVEWEKEVGAIAGANALTFEGFVAGPPGDPIEIWIQGRQMEDILAAGDQLMERLKQMDGVYQVRSDFSVGKKEVRLSLKTEARALGLSLEELAGQVYSGYFGFEALRLQRGKDDIPVKVRYTAEERGRISDFENIMIRTRTGREVPLLSVADITYGPGYSTIVRTDGMRRVAICAGVDGNKANANEILDELSSNFLPDLEQQFPSLRIAVQGEQKKVRESLGSLKVSFPIAIVGIFVIIAAMFRSYVQPFVIMFVIPFGIIGAVAGHMIMGYDLSIMSVFGMVALTGIVVNSTIVLIECVNENIARGLTFDESVRVAGFRRFRAVVLTSITTIGGLLPLILESDLQAKFLIPMALSISAGLVVSTVLTLVLTPVVMVIVNDIRRSVYKMRHGNLPSREEVEPARSREGRVQPEFQPVVFPGAHTDFIERHTCAKP